MLRINRYLLIVGLLLFSCSDHEKEKNTSIDWDQEKSTKFNKELAVEEQIQIKLFLEQHKSWKMTQTGSGLQYYIYKKGDGEQAKVGDLAQVEMEVSLLDGTVCYKTNADEYEEFVVDKSNLETGVQEGVKLLQVGDQAKLIIPSHLAHGLVGDLNKIPPLTVIVVDIKLIGLGK